MTITGGCLCGQVRYQTSADPLWICHCHCGMCRKQTGAPVATFVGFRAGTVRWTGKEPARYRSSKDAERSFCPACGSTIGFHRAQETSLLIGGFDALGEFPVSKVWSGHVWFKDRIPWFDTADDWQRYSELPPGRAEELEALSGQEIKG